MPLKRKSHAESGKLLRKLGLLPQGYRLSDLTKNQKDRIRKIERQYSGVVNHPDEYSVKHVSPKNARSLRKKGIVVKRNKAIIRKHGAQTLSVRGGKITRSFLSYKTETLTESAKDIFKAAEKFFAKKKPGEYLMLRIGDRNAFGTGIYSMQDFIKYMHRLKTAMGDETFDKIVNELYIVKVTGRPAPKGYSD